ncbi:Penicillin acylase 2 proenzyme [bioreactor metagenome]|uniref:Penicillin acylase 2 proenzyme n=1 Tax=bioreactor metagenome TaxID=1076179 RepID=A0A645BVR9_9ZZZZ
MPGDGRYEWSGYRNGDELPSEFNPPRGYVVTANENNIPPNHPLYQKGVGYEWSDSARAQRLHALFKQAAEEGRKLSVADSEAWQTDLVAVPAQRLLKLLQPLSSNDAQTAQGLELLKRWDGTMSKDSSAAALYEVWSSNTLKKALTDKVLAANQRSFAKDTSATRMIAVLESPQDWMTTAERDQVLLSSIAPAMQWLQAKQGQDPASWSWGALHRARFVHPLAAVVDDATRERLNVDAGAIGGSWATPMATSYNPETYQLTSGASFRMVVDVGNWDASRAINTPGQSGNPSDANYRDLAATWADGKYFPLTYSRSAVEKVTRERIKLTP